MKSSINTNDPETVWKRARAQVEQGDCSFLGWHFPEDPEWTGFSNLTLTNANFDRATFDGKAFFQNTRFEGATSFIDAVFSGPARFHDAKFHGKTWFSRTAFEQAAVFVDGAFHEGVSFKSTRFGGNLYLKGCRFGAKVDFGHAMADGDVELLCPWEEPSPFGDTASGEGAYRVAKLAAERLGEHRRVSDYHYAQRCARNVRIRGEAIRSPLRRGFWYGEKSLLSAWGDFFWGDLLMGYGEKPLRVIRASLIVILLWAVVYWVTGLADGNTNLPLPETTHAPLISLYFSIVTFTTLGYGDVWPTGGVRLLAAFEAFLGAALMAIFVVTLTRRLAR